MGLETGYRTVISVIQALKGGDKAADPQASITDHIEGSLNVGSGALGIAGYAAGASMPAGATGAGTALLGSTLGAGLLAGSAVLGAGAAGMYLGHLADKQFGLSDKLSDVMTGNRDDEMLLKGDLAINHPGLPTKDEQLAAAARLPVLEAKRQEEIATLTEMWTEGSASPVFGGVERMHSAAVLKDKYGIDMDSIHAAELKSQEAEEKTPAARMKREADRQVDLSKAIRARDAASMNPMAHSIMDHQVSEILGHYGE